MRGGVLGWLMVLLAATLAADAPAGNAAPSAHTVPIVAARQPASRTSPEPTPSVLPSPTPSPTPTPTPSRTPAARPRPQPTTSTKPPTTTTTAPAPAPTNPWILAGGGTGVVGPGTKGLIQYRVEVEKATGANAATVAAVVDTTLAGDRGWTNEGWSFQRVSNIARSQVDMIVWLATPATTDRLCAQWGLDTGGELSCRGGNNVVINFKRWTNGIPAYEGQVDQYRNLVLNHEIGHRLDHKHATCPGDGLPAPVMMQQYFGIEPCVTNVWPYAADGAYIG